MTIAAALWMFASLPPQAAQDWEYRAWAKCTPGSWVTSKDEARGMVIEMTSTLKSVDADAVVLETATTRTIRGKVLKDKPVERRIPAKPDPAEGKVVQEGEEELTIAEKKLKCRWRVVEAEKEGQKNSVKLWLCDEIPGAVAQMVMTAGEKGTLKRIVTGWEMK